MSDIKNTRNKINEIDQQISYLLKERFLMLEDIMEYKILNEEYIENPSREREVIEKITQEASNYGPYFEEIYQKIMDVSKCYQWNNLFNNNIYIIGFMAVGKTTLGKKLSQKIKWDFLDTDLYIEKLEQQKIKEIFTESGEEYFRDLETKLIENIQKQWDIHKYKKVIACGGGIILNPQNVQTMKKNGVIVHLEGNINTIYNRLILDQTRPLVADEKHLKKRIEKLMEDRRNIYNKVADISLHVGEETPNNLVQELIRKLEDHERERSLSN